MEHFGSKILDLVCNVQINKKGKGFKEYVPRRARTASTAVVVGTTIQTTVLFLTVTTTTLTTATTTLVSVWCVPAQLLLCGR